LLLCRAFAECQAFVEERRRRLAQFLAACLVHPELQTSPHLCAFACLGTDDALATYQRHHPASSKRSSTAGATASPTTTDDSWQRSSLLAVAAGSSGIDQGLAGTEPLDAEGAAAAGREEPSAAELCALAAGVGGGRPERSTLDARLDAELRALVPLQVQLFKMAAALEGVEARQATMAEAWRHAGVAYGQLAAEEETQEPTNAATAGALRVSCGWGLFYSYWQNTNQRLGYIYVHRWLHFPASIA
jgi:hypothetical protein